MTEAGARLTRTRDLGEWQATVARLDAERAAIMASAPSTDTSDPVESAGFLRDLGEMWARSEPRIKQELAMALWDSWQFLGFTSATYRWSAHALRYGLDRLVPAETTFDLGQLRIHGSPAGTFTLRAATDYAVVLKAPKVLEEARSVGNA